MQIRSVFWGITQTGKEARKIILTNDNGMEVELSDFGALILAIKIPVMGTKRDVCLGYDSLDAYYDNGAGFGAFVGRNGNRIANAQVVLDGVRYELEKNNGDHNLHSGENRSYYQHYGMDIGMEAERVWVEFSRVSPALEQGFPGDLQQSIRYTLTNKNDLTITYRMLADKTTVINPTNHCYFNLMGHDSGRILGHRLTIYADAFLPTDDGLIPTGEVRNVEGTPFDFRTPHTVGERIGEDYEPLRQAGGYDHNFCYPGNGGQKDMACLESDDGLVSMTVQSDLCGMQLYSGNFLSGEKGKDGAIYHRRSGICFETQGWPNACNMPGFPRTVYAAGEVFESQTTYHFAFRE